MLKTIRLSLIIAACVLAATAVIAHRGKASSVPEQDVLSLDRRISSIEQRLFSLESNITQLQQQVMASRTSPTSPNVRDPETERLRSEILLLERRIREVECGVVKLDERTLSPTARASRPTQGQGSDPCRLRPETPLQLTSRPR